MRSIAPKYLFTHVIRDERRDNVQLYKLIASQILSFLAEEFLRFALPVAFFLNTSDAFGAAILYCCIYTPRILLGPLLSCLNDYFNPFVVFRKTLLCQVSLTALLSIALIYITSIHLNLWCFFAFVLSAFHAIKYSTVQTLLPTFWSGRNLLRANSFLVSLDSVVLFAAPVVAAIFLDYVGIVLLSFSATALNFLAYFLQRKDPGKFMHKNSQKPTLKQIFLEGWVFISKHRGLRLSLLLTSPVNFLLGICLVVLTPMIIETHQHKSQTLGIVMSAGAVGMFFGGMISNFLGRYKSLHWIQFSGVMIAGSCGLFTMGLFPSFIGWLLEFLLWGIGISMSNTALQTFWQLICPEYVRSRAISVRLSIKTALIIPGFLLAIPFANFLTPYVNGFGGYNSYNFVFMIAGILLFFLGLLGSLFRMSDVEVKGVKNKASPPIENL